MSFDLDEHEYTKYRVRAVGLTFADLAVKLSVSKSMITRVSQGKTISDKVQRGIADAVGLPAEKLWPKRYPANKEDKNVDS